MTANRVECRKVKIRDRNVPAEFASVPAAFDPSSETSTAFTSMIGGCRRGRPSGGVPSCRALSSGLAIGTLRIPRTPGYCGCAVTAMQLGAHLGLTDPCKQRLLIGLAHDFDDLGARRGKRSRNLGG